MKINPTEQTSTFPVPVNKLKGHLMDNIGLKWKTPQGYQFEITKDNIPWLVKNAKTSMFNDHRSYIYNKAFYEAFYNLEQKTKTELNVFDSIRDWAQVRGIYNSGDSKTQFAKLVEEVGELAQGILKNDKAEIKDAIGDIVVVVTNLAHLEQMKVEDCISSAYDEIKDRKGSMANGTFVKKQL